MKRSRKVIQRLVAAIMIVLAIIIQVAAAGRVFNGATIIALAMLVAGIFLLIFDVNKIKDWIKEEFLSFEEIQDDGIDIIPWIDSSEYNGEKKEGIIIKFPKSD